MKSQFEISYKHIFMSFTLMVSTVLSATSFAHEAPYPLSGPRPTDQLHEYLNPFHAQSRETHLYREITDADAALENRLQLIEKARRSIIIEAGDFKKDDTGRAILKALLKKASSMKSLVYVRDAKTPPKKILQDPRTGVSFQMRLLVDYQSSGKEDIDLQTAKLLMDAGIEVRYFHVPIIGLFENYRDHRNLMIVDNEVCISGGQISDNYFLRDQQARDLCLQGKIARPALKNFYAFWYLKDGTYKGHFAEIPKFPASLEMREAQALLIEDPELNQKIQTRRDKGQPILQNNQWKVSNSVSLISDLLGTDTGADRTSSIFAANKGENQFEVKCTGTMNLTFAKSTLRSDVMICIDDKLTGAVAAPVIVPKPVVSKVDLTNGRVVDIQARYRFKPEKQECIDSNSDPFDPGAYMKDGPDKGACADTSDLRIPVILDETSDTITIANFRHARRFWVATINKNAIEEVYFQNGTFGEQPVFFTTAAHSQIRMIMNKKSPILLQEQKVGSKEVLYISQFEISAEPYNVRDGNSHDESRIITRFVSQLDRGMDEMGYKIRKFTDQIELKLNSTQRAHLLRTAIYRSMSQGYTRYYTVWRASCAVEAVKTIAMAFPPKNGENASAMITLLNAIDPVIGPTTKVMKTLGLANDESASYTLEDEFSSPIPFIKGMRQVTPDNREKKKLDALLSDAEKGNYDPAHDVDLKEFN